MRIVRHRLQNYSLALALTIFFFNPVFAPAREAGPPVADTQKPRNVLVEAFNSRPQQQSLPNRGHSPALARVKLLNKKTGVQVIANKEATLPVVFTAPSMKYTLRKASTSRQDSHQSASTAESLPPNTLWPRPNSAAQHHRQGQLRTLRRKGDWFSGKKPLPGQGGRDQCQNQNDQRQNGQL
jgi:hypothetical protein